MDKILRIRTRF